MIHQWLKTHKDYDGTGTQKAYNMYDEMSEEEFEQIFMADQKYKYLMHDPDSTCMILKLHYLMVQYLKVKR